MEDTLEHRKNIEKNVGSRFMTTMGIEKKQAQTKNQLDADRIAQMTQANQLDQQVFTQKSLESDYETAAKYGYNAQLIESLALSADGKQEGAGNIVRAIGTAVNDPSSVMSPAMREFVGLQTREDQLAYMRRNPQFSIDLISAKSVKQNLIRETVETLAKLASVNQYIDVSENPVYKGTMQDLQKTLTNLRSIDDSFLLPETSGTKQGIEGEAIDTKVLDSLLSPGNKKAKERKTEAGESITKDVSDLKKSFKSDVKTIVPFYKKQLTEELPKNAKQIHNYYVGKIQDLLTPSPESQKKSAARKKRNRERGR